MDSKQNLTKILKKYEIEDDEIDSAKELFEKDDISEICSMCTRQYRALLKEQLVQLQQKEGKRSALEPMKVE